MRYSTKEPGLATKHVHYPAELKGKCLYCGSEVEEAYVTAGHRYTDFSGDVNEVRHLMRCTNRECELYNVPYNPTPSKVLPFKQYSLAVWKWIAGEYKLYNQNAGQIQERAKEVYYKSFSVPLFKDRIFLRSGVHAPLITFCGRRCRVLGRGECRSPGAEHLSPRIYRARVGQ